MLVGEVFARMGLDDKQYKKGLDRLEGVTQKKAMTLGSIFKGAFSFAIGIGVIQGFRSLGGAITDFVNTAARTEVLDVAMMAVARSTRHTTTEIREQEEALRDLGIAKQEAKQMLTRFMQAQIDVADVTKLARVAQDAAVIAGYNSSEAAQQMTEAIAKQRPELLTAFGFTRNLNDIYNDYAKTVGKTVKQLSEIEKKQAMVNYILKEGEKIAGTYEASMGAVGKIIGSLKRYWDDLKDAIAMPLALPAISVFVEALTNGLKNAIRWAEENKVRLQIWGHTVASVFRTIVGWVSRFVGLYIKYWTTIIKPTLKFQWVIFRMAGYFIILIKAISLAKIITQRFAYVMGILRGQTYVTGGAFGFLSAAVQYYRYQLKLANMAGITSLGVMAKTVIGIRSIGVAIKGLLASIPIIGWIVLAIGLLAEAAIYAYYNWEKVKHYGLQAWSALKQGIAYYVYGILSLYRLLFGWIPGVGKAFDVLRKKALEVAKAETAIRKARAQAFAQKPLDPYAEYEKKMEEYHKQLEEYEASLESSFAGAKDGADKTTDSIEKMNKVAGDGIQSFDEVHQLMEQAGDAAGELDDVLGLDLGLEEMPEMPEMPKMPTLEETGILKKISGMWDDIASSISTGATEAWAEFGDTMKEAREAFKGDWEKIFKAFTWENIKQKFIDGWEGFKSWFSQTWLGKTWERFSRWWGEDVAPWFTKEKWLELYNTMKTSLEETWANLKTWWRNTTLGKWWNEDIAPWFTKAKWLELYSNMKTSLQETWNSIKIWWRSTTLGKWWNEDVKPWFTKEKWLKLYSNMKIAMEEVWIEIDSWWNNTLLGKAFNWGTNLIGNIIDGIKEKYNSFRSTLSNIGSMIGNYIGFSSPTKLGEGRFADKWAPNLMKMFSEGISSNIPKVRSAVDDATRQISGIATPSMVQQPTYDTSITADNSGFVDEIAQAVYRAIIDAFRITQASSGQNGNDDKELVLKIDNTVLARMQIPAIIREGQRQGLDLVVRPQGV